MNQLQLHSKSSVLAVKVPQKKGDPLGIGRPYITPPPDPEPYNQEQEKSEYALSIFTPTMYNDFKKNLESNKEESEKYPDMYTPDGFFTISHVRRLVMQNCVKDNLLPDPEVLLMIDPYINYKIFIADNTVYTREELYENYAFTEFECVPEDFFSRQVIGVFEELVKDEKDPSKPPTVVCTYDRKDEDEESMEFIKVTCMLKLDKDPNYEPIRPTKIVKTKIYFGGETFNDFVNLQKQMRSIIKIKRHHEKNPGHGHFFDAIVGSSNLGQHLQAIEGLREQQKALALTAEPDNIDMSKISI